MSWPALLRPNRRYPGIKVEVSIETALTDIVAEPCDAGVRRGEQIARDMIALCIGPDLRMAVVGCPAYLADHGIPVEPQDLTHHAAATSACRPPAAVGLGNESGPVEGRPFRGHDRL
jgi:DNA-binding transcriptional LysR family regulator